LGKSRFYAKIESLTGQPREAKPRSRPRVERDESSENEMGQGELALLIPNAGNNVAPLVAIDV
jgi:hypothetical protein